MRFPVTRVGVASCSLIEDETDSFFFKIVKLTLVLLTYNEPVSFYAEFINFFPKEIKVPTDSFFCNLSSNSFFASTLAANEFEKTFFSSRTPYVLLGVFYIGLKVSVLCF